MVAKFELTEENIAGLKIEGLNGKGEPKTLAKYSAGNGLHLLIDQGGKSWRFRYYVSGRERLSSLGKWPAVTLAAARAKARELRDKVDAGTDPLAIKQEAKLAAAIDAENTFERIALEFLERQDDKAPKTRQKHQWLLRLTKRLHATPVSRITAPMVLELVKPYEARDKRETAHRLAWFAARVLRHAVQTGRLQHNPVSDMRGALRPIKVTARAAITDPERFGKMLSLIEDGRKHGRWQDTVTRALLVLAHTFVRPGKEFRFAEWIEFDLDKAEWRIPAIRMKMRRPHVVPLSSQVVAMLKEQKEHSGAGKYVWPSARTDQRPISEGTFTAALSSLYYDGEHTPHGFRSTASTLLNELGFDSSIIELQLAHAKKDQVAAIYDRSQKLPERRGMMQAWSDYLDTLKAGAP